MVRDIDKKECVKCGDEFDEYSEEPPAQPDLIRILLSTEKSILDAFAEISTCSICAKREEE
jgi:hypothetical protein